MSQLHTMTTDQYEPSMNNGNIIEDLYMKVIEQKRAFIKVQNLFQQVKEMINPEIGKHIDQLIRASLEHGASWGEYESQLMIQHPNFFNRMKHEYPELRDSQLRICAYLKMGLTNKEIAELFNIQTDSVKRTQNRVKHKIGVPEGMTLRKFLNTF